MNNKSARRKAKKANKKLKLALVDSGEIVSTSAKLNENEDRRTEKRKVGDIGESVACNYLLKSGFKIIDRNYLKKYGEIDVIAEKGGTYHFIEVKTVTHVTGNGIKQGSGDEYRPEDNVHGLKLKRMANAIQAYIMEKKIFEAEWTVDVIAVRLDMATRMAKVEILKDIVL